MSLSVPRQLAIRGGAGLARVEMRSASTSGAAAPTLVVVVEDQIFFDVVLHDSPRNGPERGPQFPDRAEDAVFRRARPEAERLADFRDRSPLVVPQRERRALERA